VAGCIVGLGATVGADVVGVAVGIGVLVELGAVGVAVGTRVIVGLAVVGCIVGSGVAVGAGVVGAAVGIGVLVGLGNGWTCSSGWLSGQLGCDCRDRCCGCSRWYWSNGWIRSGGCSRWHETTEKELSLAFSCSWILRCHRESRIDRCVCDDARLGVWL
jgi:hypothetical protein